jgi:hypothetical protein
MNLIFFFSKSTLIKPGASNLRPIKVFVRPKLNSEFKEKPVFWQFFPRFLTNCGPNYGKKADLRPTLSEKFTWLVTENTRIVQENLPIWSTRIFLTLEGQLKNYQRDLTFLTQNSEAEISKRVDNFFIGPLDRN